MAHSEVGNERLAEMKKRLEQDMTDLFRDGELSSDEIRNAALEVMAQLVQKIQELPAERGRGEVRLEEPEKIMDSQEDFNREKTNGMETAEIREKSAEPDAEKNGQAEALEELPELTLLVSNKNRTEYDLFFVGGMEKSEVMRTLSGMEGSDRADVETALEAAGAVASWQGDEESREFREFHLNVTYDRDTKEVVDVQQKMSEQRRNGRAQPETTMEQIDRIMDNQELSPMKQTEEIINLLEKEKTIFTLEDKNLLVNHAYKLQDMEQTLNLMLRLSNEREHGDVRAEETADWIKAEIDFLPDRMVGMAEMYEYGYRWDEMLPLTKETALELYDKELPILRLYPDDTSNIVEDRSVMLEHEGMFGIERSDWEDYLAEQSRNQEQEETISQEELAKEQGEAETETPELPTEAEQAEPVSYYVIEDISTWKNSSAERSELERFDNLSDAMARFMEYGGKERDYSDGDAKTTLGVKIGLSEFDLLYMREQEHYLVQDFLQIPAAQESNLFKKDLQTIYDTIGFDKISLTRDMTPEEVKDFVRDRIASQLKQGGVEDISLYMERFDSLYEQGGMDNLMPTASQKRVTDVLPISEWENPYLTGNGMEEMAVAIADRYVSIQTCEDGYDYSIFDNDYKLLDGGVYDNPHISIHAALHEIIMDLKESAFNQQLETYYRTPQQGEVRIGDDMKPIDYDGLMERAEQAEYTAVQKPDMEKNQVVEEFKRKTEVLFHPIREQKPEDIEQTVFAYIQSKIDEYEIDVRVVDLAVSGSRSRGLEQAGSDLDVVVEYAGREREDDMFNALNEDGLQIGGIKVDINPVTEGQTGTLAAYLPGVEAYLAEKSTMQEKPVKGQIQPQEMATEPLTEVTLTVAECGEFPSLGEYHEGIRSVEEAIAIFKEIPPERMNGIPSIGIQVHTEGTENYEDIQLDIFSGNIIDLEILSYVPEIAGNARALQIIEELIEQFPDSSIIGALPELSERNRKEAAGLAAEVDAFAYEYDVYQYRDTVEDRQVQVEEMTADIQAGKSLYMKDFLLEIIEEDAEPESVEKAKELLQHLEEYKPLAMVEELEEANYNMIDNTLNNEKPKKEKEQERSEGRISVKEKLTEKKAALAQEGKTKSREKGSELEKKAYREI